MVYIHSKVTHYVCSMHQLLFVPGMPLGSVYVQTLPLVVKRYEIHYYWQYTCIQCYCSTEHFPFFPFGHVGEIRKSASRV